MGFEFLKRYARKTDDTRFATLAQFASKPDHVKELIDISVLIWYLDSGGNRDYRIAGRPDQDERSLARPDFLLTDRNTGDSVAVEVTRLLIASDIQGAVPLKRQLAVHLRELVRDSSGIPAGRYEVRIGDVMLRGLDRFATARSTAKDLIDTLREMPFGRGRKSLDGPIGLTVVRQGEAREASVRIAAIEDLIDESRLRRVIRKLGEPSTSNNGDPFERWEIEPYFQHVIRAALDEAGKKFEGMQHLHTALLMSMPHSANYWQMDLYEDRILRRFHFGYLGRVHRFYLRYEEDDYSQMRIRRVW